MKKITFLFAGISLLIFHQMTIASILSDNSMKATPIQPVTELKISSTPELVGLTRNWVSSFTASQPVVPKVTVGIIDGSAVAVDNLSLIADENSAMVTNPANWKMVVGRDVIIPIINQNNPMIRQIRESGVSAERFGDIFGDPSKRAWNVLFPNVESVPLVLYLKNDENIQSGLRDFTSSNINTKDAKVFISAAELIAAVSLDKYAIGFCKLNDFMASGTTAAIKNVVLLPIDKNGNGRMDNFENIYASLDDFIHGVWVGKYPKSLSSCIYAVSSAKPANEAEVAFLSWIMANGQELLNTYGYCDLTTNEKKVNIASLVGTPADESMEAATASAPRNWPVVLAVAVLLGLFVVVYYYSRKSTKSPGMDQEIEFAPLLIEQAVNVPNGLYFDKTHTWAFMEQDGNVRIGIDDFLQHITGKLTNIKMKQSGEKVRKGETIMSIIQDGKQLNIYAPISGTILSHNELLRNDTTLLNSSPFFKGWVYQIEPTNWLREAQFMLMGEKYREWLRDEFVRLKDFMATTLNSNQLAYSHVVLQDGGALSDNVLASLEPKVWEDFQTQFIDTSR